MILRRAAEHLKQQHWTAFVIELAIVVLGVFMGMQVSNWNQAQKDRETGRAIVENLYADYTATEHEGESRLAEFHSRHASISELLSILRAPKPIADGAALSKNLASVFSLPPALGASATQQEIMFSGQMDLIANSELRVLLVGHAERIRMAQLGDQARREFVRPYAMPVVRLNMLLLDSYPAEDAIALAGGRDELRIGLHTADVVYQSEQGELEETLASLRRVRAKLIEQRRGALK